jgi:hypothetical protein
MRSPDLGRQPPFMAYIHKLHTVDIGLTPPTQQGLKTRDIGDLMMCRWINGFDVSKPLISIETVETTILNAIHISLRICNLLSFHLRL